MWRNIKESVRLRHTEFGVTSTGGTNGEGQGRERTHRHAGSGQRAFPSATPGLPSLVLCSCYFREHVRLPRVSNIYVSVYIYLQPFDLFRDGKCP